MFDTGPPLVAFRASQLDTSMIQFDISNKLAIAVANRAGAVTVAQPLKYRAFLATRRLCERANKETSINRGAKVLAGVYPNTRLRRSFGGPNAKREPMLCAPRMFCRA